MDHPYKAENRGSYWLLVDTRTDAPASYPTTKANCQAEARQMNRLYAELVAEEMR
jgi:hypothetical protein